MSDILQESKCLASLAVFRELYDSQKNVYAIISEFLHELIISKGKHSFSVAEITSLLNQTYDFNIPEAVVRTSLNRLDYLNKNKGVYTVAGEIDGMKFSIDLKQAESDRNNNIIIENLFTFIESESGSKLSDAIKSKVVHSFCSFLLDESISKEFSEYIGAYIISNRTNFEFMHRLNAIREGVILYSGIKYNSNLSDVGSWKATLTIFIDTEIIFDYAGYHGSLYKALFEDLYSFIKEINQKNSKRIIKLKYFREVKDEIDRFFKKAEYIVTGKEREIPRGDAMISILDGCTSASDVVLKKTSLYQFLKTSGITEDDFQDYYHEDNYKYNIIDNLVVDNVSKSTGINDVSEAIKYLNYISIRRADASNSNFDNIKYILLTGNYKTLQVAWSDEIKKNSGVPLATTVSFLTNKFWYKLNKGFGGDNYPKSFDIIIKAKMLLSSMLNDSVSSKYDQLQSDFRTGKLTEEQALATIVELRKQSLKPEEINENDITSVLNTLNAGSIEKYIQEQEHFKYIAKKESEENIRLKESLASVENELNEKIIDYNKSIELKKENELLHLTDMLILKEKMAAEKRSTILSLAKIK